MAKKETLSLDELLEEALVKDEGKPFSVPSNWVWTRLKYIAELVTGSTPSKANIDYYGNEFPFIKPSDLDQGRNVQFSSEYLSELGKSVSRVLPEGSISVCCIGSIGKAGYLEIEATTNQQINSLIPKISNLYTYYYCLTDTFQNELKNLSSATTISIVNKAKMSTICIPLPPLPEQQRIVDLIESLFEKLDRAKELVQNALDSFVERKSAILHKAFTGELTVKWRGENGVDFEKDWENKRLGEISSLITKGASPRWQGINYTDDKTQVLFITSENVREGFLDLSSEKYLEIEINNKQKRSVLRKGDVLVNIVGASIGRSAIFNMEKVANINQAVCLIRLSKVNSNKYLCYYLNSPEALKYYSDNKVDVARANLSLQDINNITLPIPPIEEQKEIVRILDELLENEQKARELCDIVDNIDLMKKSILARAFRGELNTNNPNEESAFELLKKVLKEKVESK
jgi:restriction endonuclease S subunit